jgi:hypothetical protein
MGEEFFNLIVLLVVEVGFVFSKNNVSNGFFLKSMGLPSTSTMSKSSLAP